jgi:hypothetical protein
LPCRYVIEAGLQLRPSEDNALLLVNLQPLDPEGHLLQPDFIAKFEIHSVSFRVQHQSLFCVILADYFKVKHTATIDASSDESRLFLVEIGEIDQSNFQGECFNMIQMLIEYVQFEVA